MKNLITCLVACVLSGAAFADTWTVDDDGKADFDNIQAAVDAASDGDEIIVMPGTYTSTAGEVVDMLGKAVTLRSNDPSDPSVVAATIIDGENQRRGIVCFNNETEKTTIEGLTITNGYESDDGGGGGIQCNGASPTISHCIISNNEALNGAAISSSGGNTVVSDCKINNNYSRWSGGGFSTGESVPTSISFLNCEFISNNSSTHSGAIAIRNETNINCVSCLFQGNWTSGQYGGGAIRCYLGGTINLIDCSFLSNNATSTNGGGLRVDSGGIATLEDCDFCANSPEDIYGPWNDGGNNTFSDAPCFNDCNENGIDDLEDIANQTSSDCDQNSVPDECQPDCDADGLIDPCDIQYGGETDWNQNGLPDNCELDCNENGYPDDWEIENGLATDCNENGIPDECDLANSGQVPEGAVQWTIEEGGNGHWYYAVNANTPVTWNEASDLVDALGGYLATPVYEHENVWIISTFLDDESLWGNGNGYSYGPHFGGWQNPDSPDYSEPEGGWEWITGEPFSYTNWINLDDCCGGQDRLQYFRNNQNNGIWDYGWEDVHQNSNDSLFHSYIVEFASFDCNDDGFIDSCQIDDDPSLDCNANGILDSCDLTTDPNIDCNDDGLIDSCQIDDDSSLDCNGNAILDSCELAGAAPSEGAILWTIEEGGNGHWYLGVTSNASWDSASSDAQLQGGYLATCTTPEENSFVRSILDTNSGGIWIGLKQSPNGEEPAGGWEWVTGEPLVWTNWESGQPNDNGDHAEMCCNGPNWADWPGSSGLKYIIEFDADGTSQDCNSNGIPDECDIADGTSTDWNGNGIPDECEVDCNTNGVPDHWDIKTGTSEDCNANGIPDECDIDDDTSNDVNENDIPDECEPDCNGNGIPDAWDIETETSEDCNANGIPDECDIAQGCEADCNMNGLPDACDIASGEALDLNTNGVIDTCECISDVNGDQVVDVNDLLVIVGYWGTGGPIGDINNDGTVEVTDIMQLISDWGSCPEDPCYLGPLGAVQWLLEDGGNDHWYGLAQAAGGEVCFDEIRLLALDLGGDLVIIQSDAENSFVTDLLTPSGDYWIGLIQNLSSPDYSEPSGGWEWIDGTPLDYSHWDSSEPDDPGNTENVCGINSGGWWYDMGSCDNGPPQYAVVEWSD